MEKGPRPFSIRATRFVTIWIPSLRDLAKNGTRGVIQSHTTLVSHGFGCLAELRFFLKPAKREFSNTPKRMKPLSRVRGDDESFQQVVERLGSGFEAAGKRR